MKHTFIVSLLFSMPLFTSASGDIIPVGLGSYTTTLPSGKKGPSDAQGNPALPKVTQDFNKPVKVHQWWSSLIWQFESTPYSQNLFAYPLSARAQAQGLDIGYTKNPAVTPEINTGSNWKAQEYHYNFSKDLTIGIANLSSPDTKVADYSDWTVTTRWQNDARSLTITLGRGLPFVYCTATGDKARITCAATPTIWYQNKETIGLSVNGKHYGIFAPVGSNWQGTKILESSLNGKNYFSVALLPDNSIQTLQFFREHAYAFVTDTKVSWTYDQTHSRLLTTYTVSTTLKETSSDFVNKPIIALFRHQWLYTDAQLTPYTYASPRSVMKVLAHDTFTTALPFNGVIPALPLSIKDTADSVSFEKLYSYVDKIYKQSYATRWNNITTEQSYWIGKALGKIAQLIFIADQIKYTQARDLFLKETKEKLQAWFSASDNNNRLFFYDELWNTLIGFPESFGSNTELNDHHFHWGYFIMAAATVAHFDQAWATDSQWGGMVKLLIKDAANSSRLDRQFPFLSHFDIYQGHSWANGPALFSAGNNQESSSEAINFAAAAFLWGAATQNNTVRDLGIFLYATEIESIKQYWFDVDDAVFPADFKKPTLGILWGNGGAYAIWFAGNVEQVHGINFLPITAASLYLGHDPSYLQKNLNYALPNNALPPSWKDIILETRALYDPKTAFTQLNSMQYTPEAGESLAHTYHWIANLQALGIVDTTITANVPSYAVFTKNGKRTYVAYNYSTTPTTVIFSDGKQLVVAPRTLATSNDSTPPQPEPQPVDFTQQIIENNFKVLFTPTTPSVFVDLHYRINGVNQQNVRMINQNGIWVWAIPAFKTGDTLTYFFTYTKNGLAYDSKWFTYK